MTIVRRTVLVALSLLVLSTVIAAASASAHKYLVMTTPVTAKGGVQKFVFGELILTCKKDELMYGGHIGPFEEIDLTPVYKECSLLGSSVAITVTKLKYAFESPTEIKAKEFSVPVALVGETGASMKMTTEIAGEKCELSILPQKIGNTGTKFQNNSGNTGAEVKAKFEGLAYKTNSKCAGLLPKEGKAQYEGNALETGLIIE